MRDDTHHASSTAGIVDKLDATVSLACRSPLYRERLEGIRIRNLDDLSALPLTTRSDIQQAGRDGTRAASLEEICHYGETSGTTGVACATWLTAADLRRSADAIAARHPEIFAPGRILLNRFPFMAAPAHLIQLVAQHGGGVAIPAGNVNWDVPFPRALDLAQSTRAHVLAGFPLEPIILAQIARTRGLDPAKATSLDTFFLGGAALPPSLQRRIGRVWGARVVELYGSTETMLLGTGCAAGSLHLEPDLVHCEILAGDGNEPVGVNQEGRLVVTTIGIEGSPLVRFDTGDLVRRLPTCECGDPRQAIVVLGRESDVVRLAGRRLHSYEIIDAAAAAADSLDSSVFFTIVLPDRLLVRIEAEGRTREARDELSKRLGDLPIEIELTGPNELLDVENLSRSPSVYKPVVVSDWRGPSRRILSVSEGMIEWPSLGLAELRRMLMRMLRGKLRRRRLAREIRVAKGSRH